MCFLYLTQSKSSFGSVKIPFKYNGINQQFSGRIRDNNRKSSADLVKRFVFYGAADNHITLPIKYVSDATLCCIIEDYKTC